MYYYIKEKNDDLINEGKQPLCEKEDVKHICAFKDLHIILSFYEEKLGIKNMNSNLCINFYDDSITDHRLTFYHNNIKYFKSYGYLQINNNNINNNLVKFMGKSTYKYRFLENIQIKTLQKNNTYDVFLKYYEVKKLLPTLNNFNNEFQEKSSIKDKITAIFINVIKKCHNYIKIMFNNHINKDNILNLIKTSEQNIIYEMIEEVDNHVDRKFIYNIPNNTNIDSFNIKINPHLSIKNYTNKNTISINKINSDKI